MLVACFKYRLQVDVTNKESIAKAKKYIEEKEGKLHILVNKCVLICKIAIDYLTCFIY